MMEGLGALLIKLFGPVMARIILATLLKKGGVELDAIGSGDMAETLADSIDIGGWLAKVTGGKTKQWKGNYIFETIGERVALKLTKLFEYQNITFTDGERDGILQAARETMNTHALRLLLETRFDAHSFKRHLSRIPPKHGFAREAEQEMYTKLLQACAQFVFDLADQLPHFTRDTTALLLDNDHKLLSDMERVLDLQAKILEESYGRQQDNESQTFANDYLSLLATELDQLQMFGVDLMKGARQPLTVAFIKSRVKLIKGANRPDIEGRHSDEEKNVISAPQALTHSKRLVIVGRAGYGKTTLLKWGAVQCARGIPDDDLNAWEQHVPFFLRLREFTDRPLPRFAEMATAPTMFTDMRGDDIEKKWVKGLLQAGKAIVILDGLDEVNDDKRTEALTWLERLLAIHKNVTVLVSTRPNVLDNEQYLLTFKQMGFRLAYLQQLKAKRVKAFIRHWYQAMGDKNCRYLDKHLLPEMEQTMLKLMATNKNLRELANTPLLCAMLCALHLQEAKTIPENRFHLYKLCIQLLLNRDRLREMTSPYLPDTVRELLGSLAYWSLQHEKSLISRIDAERALKAEKFKDTAQIVAYLSERTSILQQESKDEFSFIHRSFQEYLAAEAIVRKHHVALIAKNSTREEWRETILMVAAHATIEDQNIMLNTLYDVANNSPNKAEDVHILAWEFWQSLDIYTEISSEIMLKHVERLIGKSTNFNVPLNVKVGESLCHFPQLTGLSFYGRELDLSFLSQLPQISYLFMGHVNFNEQNWSTLQSISQLSFLAFDGFTLKESLRLSKLSQITSLSFWNSRFEDLSFLSELTQLKSLFFIGGNINNISSLQKLSQLTCLHLSNYRTGDLLSISELKNLTSLSMEEVAIRDWSFLSELPHLNSLSIGYINIIGWSPTSESEPFHNMVTIKDWSPLSNLKSLSLDNMKIKDWSFLSQLSQLESLSLWAMEIEDWSFLSQLTQLNSLSIGHMEIEDWSFLSQLTQLNSLSIEDIKTKNWSFLYQVKQFSSLFINVRIRDFPVLNQSLTLLDEKPFSYLNSLTIESKKIEDWSFLSELSHLSSLTINDSIINDLSLISELLQLTNLSLTEMYIEDWSFLSNLTQLEALDIRGSYCKQGLLGIEKLLTLKSLTLTPTQSRVLDTSLLESVSNLKINVKDLDFG